MISFIGALLLLYHSLDVKLLRKRKRNLRVELTSMKRMKKVESEQNLQWKLILRQFVLMQSELVVTFLRMYRLTCLKTCRLRICCPRTCCLKRSCYVSKCSYSHSQWLFIKFASNLLTNLIIENDCRFKVPFLFQYSIDSRMYWGRRQAWVCWTRMLKRPPAAFLLAISKTWLKTFSLKVLELYTFILTYPLHKSMHNTMIPTTFGYTTLLSKY